MKHLSDANKNKLLALLRSRAAAGEASLKSWGRDQRPQIPGILAEEIADALVAEGKATRETKVHGGRVWRAAVEPIEKKHLDLSLEDEEAPPAPTPEPDVEEEPVAVAGAAEPPVCAWCEQRKADPRQGALEDQLDQARTHAARCELEADALRAELKTVTQDANSMRLELRFAQAFASELASALGVHPTTHQRDLLARVAALLGESRAGRPAVDPGAIAHYLLELPADRWQALATARQQLAEGRTLGERGARLQEEALAAVDRLLDAPAGDAPAEPAPPSGEQPAAGGTMIDRTLEFFQAHPTEGFRAQQLAEALGGDRQSWTVPLSQLTTRGEVERVERGVYRLARKARRSA